MSDFWAMPRKLPIRCERCGTVTLHTVTAFGQELLALCDTCDEPLAWKPTATELRVFERYAQQVLDLLPGAIPQSSGSCAGSRRKVVVSSEGGAP